MLAPATRAALRVLAPRGLAARHIARYNDVVVGRPSVRIPLAEKLVHGVFLVIGVFGYPTYTLFAVAEIKRREYANIEMPDF